MSEPRRLVLAAAIIEQFRADFDELSSLELVERYELSDAADESLLPDALAGAWAVVAGSEPYGRETFCALPELRALVRWGTGSDAVDIPAATEHGVAVVTTPGANADAVADMALALMLASLRRIPLLERAVRSGEWRPSTLNGDLACATVGVIGLGAIGRAVARRLRGFDCRIIGVEPFPDLQFCREYGIEIATLEDALPQLDVLTLHAPLSDGTDHLIGAAELAQLPPHAVVVNTSRGPLIDQAALVDALQLGTIAGAGLDVFESEPLDPSDPLLLLPNAVLTGHASSFTRLGMGRTSQAVIANLRQLVTGTLPSSCLNPEAWAGDAIGSRRVLGR
jgi:D-3-phosphoglycerate dehydrogenase / 2-oxoglutarate reductase